MTAVATRKAPRGPRRLSISRTRRYTPDEFLDLESNGGVAYELGADGRLEERKMGQESDEIALAIGALLVAYAAGRGRAMGGGVGLQIFPDRPQRIPRGDAVYISKERLPQRVKGHLQVAPELVVEVVSPHDNAQALEGKIQEYFSAGVVRVWVVYPEQGTVAVRRPDGTSNVLGVGDTISGEDAAPGFTAPVASFFPE